MDFALVCTYSWDLDTAVYFYETEEAAMAALKATFDAEVKIDAEEGNVFEVEYDESGWYAKITNYRRSGDVDITEYRVGRIYQ